MNIILKLYNKINAMPKRRKKILLIVLYCIAPIEMLCLNLGIFGYKKLCNKVSKKIHEDLK